MSDIHFYCGYVKTNIDKPFEFKVEEIEINKVLYDGTIITKELQFYGDIDCTMSFSNCLRDIELNLCVGTAFYSTDKNKCKEFVLRKMCEMNEKADLIKKRMKEAKLEIKWLEGASNVNTI